MSVSGPIAAILAVSLTVLAAVAVILLPKLIFSRLVRNYMASVRDDVDDEILSGALSTEDPAVEHLVHRVEHAVDHHEDLSMAELLSFTLRVRGNPEYSEVLRSPEFELPRSTSRDVQEKVKSYDQRMSELALLHAVVGSWFGIVSSLSLLAWFAVRHWAAKSGPFAAAKTYGRRATSTFMSTQDPDTPYALVA